jgi:hypothetical protein
MVGSDVVIDCSGSPSGAFLDNDSGPRD